VGVAILGGFRALEWAWQNVFGKSIEIYKTNKNIKKNINTYFKSVGGLWA